MLSLSTDEVFNPSTSWTPLATPSSFVGIGRSHHGLHYQPAPSRNFTVIMVVVDRLTKSAHFEALPTQFTAAKSGEVFATIVVKIHGFPSSIISDRDPVFMSKFWQTLF